MKKIKKIKISNGLFWVEIPEVQLYIQCGCPADSVKHLMKRGIIVDQEKGGATCETGPNAIVLSDMMIQNGSFANLAEFPVLQMFYRQGMIIPNHPNNSGDNPILIGLREQVEAQMRYIFRGNYGLTSKEEMLAAGVPPDQVDEQMRMKLRFAFGNIRASEALLDHRFVDSDPVEVRDGVVIQRLRVNLFRITYGSEHVDVDLNLSYSANYQAPYPLSFHSIRREYFGIIHSGDGDGWDINRPSMASILMFQGKIYLIDAGPNIMASLSALGIGINEIEGLFHTHAHDDHFAGIPTLIRAGHRIKYYATPPVRASVAKKLAALLTMPEEDFGEYFEVHDLEYDVWNNIESLDVMPLFSPHPVETSIFHFRTIWQNGYSSYAHYADIVDLDVLDGMAGPSEENGITATLVAKVKADYAKPAQIKKLDIGGGMIHGKAEDFRHDRSEKMILAHTALELTDQEKEIGSGAPFGTVDVLIPTLQEYVWKYAYEFLESYFPNAPIDQIRILLNNEVVTFNPESIILKSGNINDDIFLILTGSVEMINANSGMRDMMSAGVLVGDISALNNEPSSRTYRAASFVQALRMPCSVYMYFIKTNGLYDEVERLQVKRSFLQRTFLLGGALSYTTQNQIARRMQEITVKAGEKLEHENQPDLFVIIDGEMERALGDDILEILGPTDVFGEELAVFDTPPLFETRASVNTRIYSIAGESVRDIPLIRWKLFEIFERRRRRVLEVGEGGQVPLIWRAEYHVHINEMDQQHQELFRLGKDVLDLIDSQTGGEPLKHAFCQLIKYTHFHFDDEISLLRRRDYPELAAHERQHHVLLNQIEELKEKMVAQDYVISENCDFIEFFKKWLVDHILSEDRKYGTFFRVSGWGM
ncbi:MAG: bacteriohemerythrin [Magnetococcales bacterium]|nr:bacteriohemerythrin [Magnetococcales bacterium]